MPGAYRIDAAQPGATALTGIRLYPALSGTGPVTNTVSTLPQHDREHADQLPLGLDLAGRLDPCARRRNRCCRSRNRPDRPPLCPVPRYRYLATAPCSAATAAE